MINTIIIEDEKPAVEKLVQSISQVANDVQVIATLSTIKESISFLEKNPAVDLIFSDVQLGDGLSFQIFEQIKVDVPVIFITCFDEFMITAFEFNGIDYLLKPVEDKDLYKAFEKYKMLQSHFSGKTTAINKMTQLPGNRKRTRIVVKRGMENFTLLLEDIVLFYTENKIVFAFDQTGKKYLVDKNLSELEHELDDFTFFRANRQYIINLRYVKGFKPYEKVKLQLDLSPPSLNETCNIIISQEMAPAFRKWIYEA